MRQTHDVRRTALDSNDRVLAAVARGGAIMSGPVAWPVSAVGVVTALRSRVLPAPPAAGLEIEWQPDARR